MGVAVAALPVVGRRWLVVRVQVLGAVAAWRDRDRVRLGPAAQRAVLGLLAVAGGQPVPRAELVGGVWYGRAAPATAVNVLQTHVKHLRRLLDPDRAAGTDGTVVRRVGDGYALNLPDCTVDLLEFRADLAAAAELRRPGQLAESAGRLERALARWQGPPLADVPTLARHPKVLALVEERQAALGRYLDTMITLGRAADVLAVVEEQAAARPLDEAAQARLILAYGGAGRRERAFATFHAVRRRLGDDLGVDPGPELLIAFERVLRGHRTAATHRDAAPAHTGTHRAGVPAQVVTHRAGAPADVVPALVVADGDGAPAHAVTDRGGVPTTDALTDHPAPATPTSDRAVAPAAGPPGGPDPARSKVGALRPAQLVADLPAFAGRATELSLLDGLLASAPDPATTHGPAVMIVSGPAGMGKTCLAVHWAHRAARHFPDGQLYLDLRGFDPARPAMRPEEALRRLLDALGVASGQIPADLDEQSALYRSRLAGRRVLVVLDNAADGAQVRPLLPGGRGCLAIVTSRGQLAGLVATAAARPVPLGPLAPAEAREFLAGRVGAERAAAEPEAVDEIVARCGGLPLALAIVGARAAVGASRPLRRYADELRPAGGRLDALTTGDASTNLREVFSWSYRALAPSCARLFRLLGLHPGPDISVAAAASLAGWPHRTVRTALAGLVEANLVLERSPDRYAGHDLLWAYAAELAGQVDTAPQRAAASDRLRAHYLHSAHAAERRLNPARGPIALGPAPPGVASESIVDIQSALAWFGAEYPVLLAVLDDAAATGRDTETWQLAWTLWTFLDRQGHWRELITTQQAAVAAATRAANPGRRADAQRLLARAYTRLGRFEDARTQLREALELYHRAGDRAGQANAHLSQALVCERQGDPGAALAEARSALELFEVDGNRPMHVRARNAVAWYLALLGDHREALAQCLAALADVELLEDRRDQAPILDTLGYCHHRIGDHAEAVACFQRAVDLYGALGDRHLEGLILTHLAEAEQALGDLAAARGTWQRALGILTDLDPGVAEQVRVTLAAMPTVPDLRAC